MKGSIEENVIRLTPTSDIVSSRVKELIYSAKGFIDSQVAYEQVVLDLENVKSIDSVGVTFIVGLYKSVFNLGKKFKIIRINNEISNLFKIMKLDEVMSIEA
ncbi:MAG: STAS domain-containing protein [Clostridia bacterium]|nr:STAS domain-containing protein [Clostridia bacterium]